MDDERNDTTNAGTKKTPLTANDRKRKHRANLTDKQKAVIRQKDAERKRLKRASEKLTAKITDRRAADAARQARCRAKKRKETVVSVKVGFKNRQSKGRAMKKALNNMPKTPTKRFEVVEGLVNALTPNSKKRILTPGTVTRKSKIDEKTEKLVENFFQDDTNSRVMPGKKDVLSVKTGSDLKEKKRKRLLLDDIDNLHNLYNSTYPDNTVGRSMFFELRSPWVIPVQKQSQDVC